MALEIRNLRVSKPVIRLTDEVTLNFTLYNGSGYRITDVSIAAVLRKSAFGADSTLVSPQTLMSGSAAIANGASREFSFAFTPNAAMQSSFANWQKEYPDVYAAPVLLRVIPTYSNGDAGIVQQNFVQLYDGRFNIGIDRFELTRALNGAPNDEGESLLTDLKITLDAALSTADASMRLYYAEGDTVDESGNVIDLTAQIAAAQTGLTAAQIIAQTFSNGSGWAFLLVLSNGLESVSARTTLGKAFANVHLSGASTGGVAFGKFSASEEGAPLFECAYPARMLGGIEGVNVYMEDEVNTGGRWINGKPLYRRTIVTTSSATGYTDINLSALGFDFLRIVDSTINFKYNGSGNYWGGTSWHNPTTDSAAYDFHRVYVTGTTLRLHTGTRVQRIAEYTTIEYTKA